MAGDVHQHARRIFLKMRTVAFRFEQAATLQHDHANHEKEKSDAPPVNFFHVRYQFSVNYGPVLKSLQRLERLNFEIKTTWIANGVKILMV